VTDVTDDRRQAVIEVADTHLMMGDELGAASVAQELLEDGLADVDVVAELRKRYALDDHVAVAVVRYARAQPRRRVRSGRLIGDRRLS
jgi:hypothetical protein